MGASNGPSEVNESSRKSVADSVVLCILNNAPEDKKSYHTRIVSFPGPKTTYNSRLLTNLQGEA